MDFLGSVVVEMMKCLWDPISRQIRYIKDLNTNLDKLKNETDELRCMRDEILSEVDHAVSSGKNPRFLVQNWLKAADSSISQVNSISSEVEGGRTGWRSCGDLNSRRKLAKRVISLRTAIKEHKGKRKDFKDGKVAKSPCCPQRPEKRHVPKELEEQSSSKEAVEKVSQWLKNEAVGVICVWGMGGVGKTTIVKHICNDLEVTDDFQQVIWITVSKDRNLKAIQQRIANKMELEFGANEGIEDKQDKLHYRLNNVRYMLILDDLWQKLPLEEVGIPQPNKENRCKIVITTRINEVSNEMEADRKIKIQPLAHDEAWTLFCNKTENVILSPDIRPLAEEVLWECGGLPLAIITVGRAMRLKMKKELWQHAIRALKRADPQVSGMEGEVFRLLKLSYDCLEDPQIKSCFLYCALYSEDYEIDANILVKFWAFEQGWVNNMETLDDALNKGHAILEKLMDACLLEKGTYLKGGDFVRMHDLTRDLAIWITSPSSSCFEGQKFLVKAGEGLKQPPNEIVWEGMTKISLMLNQLTEIQMIPNCPELVSLLLSYNLSLHMIGDHFFQSMPKLQILDLSYTNITSLPQSLSLLVNLRVLIATRCCKLEEMPPVGDLKELELLNLSYSGIENFPRGVANLAKLKFLDLTHTAILRRIPPNVISRLTCLEDLRLLGWTQKVNMGTWREVATLPRLTGLQIDLSDFGSDAFTADAMSHPIWSRLTSYTAYAIQSSVIARLHFVKNVYIHKCEVFRGQISCIHNAECLVMQRCKGLQRLSQIIGESRALKHIYVCEVEGLECIINWGEVGGDNALGCLEKLGLEYLESLEKVFDGAPALLMTASFWRLRHIRISACPKLTCIFSSSMFHHLHQLESLCVSYCEQLEKIVAGGPFPDTAQLKLTDLTLSWLPKLATICRQHLVLTSTVTVVQVRDCPLLKKLPILCSKDSQEITGEIRGSREWWEGIEWEDDHSMSLYSNIYKEVK